MKRIFQFLMRLSEFLLTMIIACVVTLFVVAIIGQSTVMELVETLQRVIRVYP